MAFRRTRRGVRARFSPEAARELRELVTAVGQLIEQGMPGPGGSAATGTSGEPVDEVADLAALVGLQEEAPAAPDDPALRRLFPDAYADAEAAAEFRRFTQADLHAERLARLATLAADLDGRDSRGEVRLDDEHAGLWLGALNDVRLVLGTRLGIVEDGQEPELPDESTEALYELYSWCSWLQESLVAALAGW